MKYLSVCSGIEAATVAWHPLGWTPVAFAEIEAFPSLVLKHHYPDVPNWGDMSKFQEWPDAAIDVLVGGTPCQAFSVAGLRKGLADPRGNLTLTYLAIAARYRPQWVVWENVPGVLSDSTGAFGSFVGGLAELGYGWAYRILDAQYFGLAQRRRRVFVVGCLGGWARAAAVLLERESLQRHPAPRREARKGTASGTLRSTDGGSEVDHARANHLIAMAHGQGGAEIARDMGPTLTCNHEAPIIAHSLRAEGFDASEDGMGRGTPLVAVGCDNYNGRLTGDVATTLSTQSGDGISAGPSVLVPAVFTGDGVVADPISANEGGTYTHEGNTFRLHNCIGEPVAYALRADAARSGEAKNPSVDANGVSRLRDAGFNVEVERAPTLDCGTPHTVAFVQNQRDEVRTMEVAGALAAEPGMKQQAYVAFQSSQSGVRIDEVHATLDSNNGSRRHNGVLAFSGKEYGADAGEIAPTLRSMGHDGSHANGGGQVSVAYSTKLHNTASNQAGKVYEEYTAGLDANSPPPALLTSMQVRRLTPVECERLQGFPDQYTAIHRGGKPAADGPRYKALGNSMAVPCMRWIGERIELVESVARELEGGA